MAGTFITNKAYLAIKLETTSGTYSAPGSSDFDIQFFDITWDPEIDFWVNKFASGKHSYGSGVMGKKKLSFSAKAAMRNSSALGTAPKLGKAFKTAGQLETLNASTSEVYTPVATKDEGDSISCSANIILTPTSGNSLIISGKGCMANCSIMMDDLGQPMIAQFDWIGAFRSIADGSALTLTSPDTSVPNAVIGSAITMASTAQQIGKFKLDFGNQVELDYDPSDATGYLAAYIANRAPMLSMDPKAKLVATDAHYTRWAAGTESVFSAATATVSSAKITLSAPKAQIKTNKFAERNGENVYEQEYELHESSGDDAHTITYSA